MKNGTRFENATGKLVSKKGDHLALIDKNTLEHIPSIPMATLQKILSPQNSKILNSLNFHRLYRWEIETGTRQIIEGFADARMIHIPGGYPEIAHLIGAGSGRKACTQVRGHFGMASRSQKFHSQR
jgi:hypothetical protein